MGFWSRLLWGDEQPVSSSPPAIYASGGQLFNGLKDPALYEFIRNGGIAGVSAQTALRTACVLRCVDLLSSSQAMLPTRLVDSANRKEATEHPLYNLIRWEPNPNHTAFEFYKLMEVRRLLYGNAYALIIRGVGGRPTSLEPLDPNAVTVRQMPDWSMQYTVRRLDGETVPIPAQDILHVRDLSVDGITGEGRTKLASEAIKVARSAEVAQANIFENGMITGGALTHPQVLGPEAYQRLQTAMEGRYSGTDNAGRWMILEEGMKAERFTMTGQEAQTVEARNHQIEEVARAFGVPRPFLMMDDTSWGSGIEQLAIMFVRFGLNPGMVAWEQSMRRALLSSQDRKQYSIDIDEHELLRGTTKDQAEYFAKALGSGGSQAWLEANEVREEAGYGPHADGSGLAQPMGGDTSGQDQPA
jgi:HK97 family phage portal protein